jgi:hypothetical protein
VIFLQIRGSNGTVWGRSINPLSYLAEMLSGHQLADRFITSNGQRLVKPEAEVQASAEYIWMLEKVKDKFGSYIPGDDLLRLALTRIQGEMALQEMLGVQDSRAAYFPE